MSNSKIAELRNPFLRLFFLSFSKWSIVGQFGFENALSLVLTFEKIHKLARESHKSTPTSIHSILSIYMLYECTRMPQNWLLAPSTKAHCLLMLDTDVLGLLYGWHLLNAPAVTHMFAVRIWLQLHSITCCHRHIKSFYWLGNDVKIILIVGLVWGASYEFAGQILRLMKYWSNLS